MKLYLITERINGERSKRIEKEKQDVKSLFFKDLELTLNGEKAEKRILNTTPEKTLILDFYINIEEIDSEELTINNSFYIEAGYMKNGHYSVRPLEEKLDITYKEGNNQYKRYRLTDTPRELITKELLINTEELIKNFKLYDRNKIE